MNDLGTPLSPISERSSLIRLTGKGEIRVCQEEGGIFNLILQKSDAPDLNTFVPFYASLLHSDRGLIYPIEVLEDLNRT